MESEPYTNGVTDSSSRAMNGTYKHQELLQPDDSLGNGLAGTHTHADRRTQPQALSHIITNERALSHTRFTHTPTLSHSRAPSLTLGGVYAVYSG